MSTSTRADSGGWETVKSRRGDRRKKEVSSAPAVAKPASGGAPAAAARADGNQAVKAFSAFDALFVEDGQKQERSPPSAGGSKTASEEVKTPDTPPRSEEAAKQRQGNKKKDKKSKAQKQQQQQQQSASSDGSGKKAGRKGGAKATTAAAASGAQTQSGLSLDDLKIILLEVKERYPENEVAQLQFVADKLLNIFKDKEMPFPSNVYTKPVEQTVNMFQSVLLPAVAAELETFLKFKSVEAMRESFIAFIKVLFDEIMGSKSTAKGKIGLVLLISSIARACPIAIVRASDDIVAEGQRFCTPGKLPTLMWIFAQAEEGGTGAALALWLRVLLPQLAAIKPVQKRKRRKEKETQQTAANSNKQQAQKIYALEKPAYNIVAESMKRVFGGDSLSPQIREAAKQGLHSSFQGNEVSEPIISLSTLSTIQCALFLDSENRIPERILSYLKGLYPTLRSLAFSTASTSDLQSFIKTSLEFAARSESPFIGAGDIVVSEATENIIGCLSVDKECFEIWTTKHKGQIRGSCRVLQHLLHTSPKSFRQLMRDSTSQTAFWRMCRQLQDRHGLLLAQGKGWKCECARGAHAACKQFLEGPKNFGKKQSNWSISPVTLFVTLSVVGIVGATVAAKWDEIKFAFASTNEKSSPEHYN